MSLWNRSRGFMTIRSACMKAYVYMIETNLVQWFFADLLPSERAAVLEARYNKVCCQGKRNDIIRELQVMSGKEPEETCGHNGHKLKSRDALAEEYGYSSRNVAWYLRINSLVRPFKDLLDNNKIAFLAAVDMSYLPDEDQEIVYKVADAMGVKLKPKMAEELRKHDGKLTESVVKKLIGESTDKKPSSSEWGNVQLSNDLFRKYFAGLNAAQISEVVEWALEEWFRKEDTDV